MSLDELNGDYLVNAPIILLTEAPMDIEVLRANIELLYPRVLDDYSFRERFFQKVETAKRPGSARPQEIGRI